MASPDSDEASWLPPDFSEHWRRDSQASKREAGLQGRGLPPRARCAEAATCAHSGQRLQLSPAFQTCPQVPR